MPAQVGAVFLGVTPADQRRYLTDVLRYLRPRIDRVVVPAAGQMTIVKCALEAGYEPERIEASDISLFTSVLGYLYSGRPLDELPMKLKETMSLVGQADVEGVEETFRARSGDAEGAAYLLWLLKLKQLKTSVFYERVTYEQLLGDRTAQIAAMAGKLSAAQRTYEGVRYEIADLRQEIARVGDDPRTLLIVNPPAYAAGSYAKMFPVDEFVEKWPVFEEFDWKREFWPTYEKTRSMAAPTIWYKKYRELDGHEEYRGDVIYAKALVMGEFDLWMATKAEMLEGYAHRSAIDFRKEQAIRPYRNMPTWGWDDELTAGSEVQVVKVGMEHALYYRDLWAHRLGNTKAEAYYLILIDGKVFGAVGFHVSDLYRMKTDNVFEVFGFSAPSRIYKNINRLLMYVITTREMKGLLEQTSRVNRMYTLRGLKTTCLSKYRHVKLNSGILKKGSVEKMKNGMYKIQYETEFRDETFNDSLKAYLAEWRVKKEEWVGRQASETTTN